MQLLQTISTILNKKSTYLVLVSLIFLISCCFFIIYRDGVSGDYFTYIAYVKGLQEGRYSYWYFLKDYVPDTFRNPGYPLFLYIFSFFGYSIMLAKIVQLLLLFGAIFLMIKIIEHLENSYILKNLFLIALIANFVVLSYPGLIYPETLMIFLITLIVYIEICVKGFSWKKILFLSLLYGFCFQVRPVILFLPIIRFVYFLYYYKRLSIIKNIAFIALFIITLLPYGYWNYKNHHQFKITPLEGGAGAMYLGYWSPKMINHVEDRYWRNVMYKDILINFTDDKSVPNNVKIFNNELDSIERICEKYLSKKDKENIAVMKQYPGLFITNNTKYTIEREKIIKSLAIKHYLKDWKYSIKLKTFTFFRLWYTSLSLNPKQSQGAYMFFPTVIAFITTLSTLFLFLLYFCYCLLKRRNVIFVLAIPLLLCLYFDIFHVPFVIQSRYTIPVRMLYLFSLAFMIYKVHFSKNKSNEPHQNI